MATKIKNINISAFRGIPCMDLPLENNSLLLIGENGTGKSSIVDAMEFFFKGEVSSLTKTQGISLKRHVPHKNFEVDDIKIEVKFTGNETVTKTFDKRTFYSSNLKNYFKVAENGTFILRRKQLLNVIDAKPAERFNAITDLIGIDPLKTTEKEMRQARTYFKKELDQNKNSLENIIQDISKIVGQEIKSADEVLPVLNNLLEKNDLPIIDSFEGVSAHTEKLYRYTKSSDKVDLFYTLQEIVEKSKKNIITVSICEKISDLNIEFSKLMQDNLGDSLSILELLKTGKAILMKEKKIDSCPLCEQTIDRQILLKQIETRYETLEELRQKLSKIKKESLNLDNDIKRSMENLSSIKKKMNFVSELETLKNKLSIEIEFLDNLIYPKKSKHQDIQIPPLELIKHYEEINNILNKIIKESENLESKIELKEEEKKFLEFIETITKATSKMEDLKRADEKLKTSAANFEIAEKIYDKFSSLKSSKIQEIFNSIKIDMQKFYSYLHPNDPHKNIDLKITGKGSSAVLQIESFGRPGEDPRAFTSEGHLDTLGLCIFLAFVKKFNRNCSLMILDDIVTTVDSAHRESICRLLFEEFKKKQFIITTHDGLWFKQVISLIDAYGLTDKFLKCSIYRWDENNGPSIKNYKLKWERIPERINSGDKSCAGNEIRQYLEWVLENVCKSTGASLPINDRGYTVGELIGPARRTLKDLIADEETKNEIRDTFKEIDKSIMGNLLSHHNTLSANASIKDVTKFFESVNKLHMLVSCPTCKRFLRYERNADRMICSKTCRKPTIIETNMI